MLCWTLRKDNCGPGSPPPSPNKYPRIKTRPPSLRPTLAVLLRTQSLRKRSRREGANTMIMERGARPDAPPNPKRSRTTLAVIVALGVGLALGFGAGVGLGKHWAQGAQGQGHEQRSRCPLRKRPEIVGDATA